MIRQLASRITVIMMLFLAERPTSESSAQFGVCNMCKLDWPVPCVTWLRVIRISFVSGNDATARLYRFQTISWDCVKPVLRRCHGWPTGSDFWSPSLQSRIKIDSITGL